MIQKEEFIVYPVAVQTVEDKVWREMHAQSFEYPFPFIEPPKKPDAFTPPHKTVFDKSQNELISGILSETGKMTIEQTLLAFNNLPIDITFVDEKDTVVFFNKAKERLFPRSPAVIGRAVQNCHPPESVHVVEEIIEAFRSGRKDEAEFWIQMKGRFISIRYFALRNETGVYKGVLEVSQDVTGIRTLEGERRLLEK
jgi:PAS domain S-box-containing protein